MIFAIHNGVRFFERSALRHFSNTVKRVDDFIIGFAYRTAYGREILLPNHRTILSLQQVGPQFKYFQVPLNLIIFPWGIEEEALVIFLPVVVLREEYRLINASLESTKCGADILKITGVGAELTKRIFKRLSP